MLVRNVFGGYRTHPPWLSLWAKFWEILLLDLCSWLVSSELAVTSLNGSLCRNSCFAGSTLHSGLLSKDSHLDAMLVAPTAKTCCTSPVFFDIHCHYCAIASFYFDRLLFTYWMPYLLDFQFIDVGNLGREQQYNCPETTIDRCTP